MDKIKDLVLKLYLPMIKQNIKGVKINSLDISFIDKEDSITNITADSAKNFIIETFGADFLL